MRNFLVHRVPLARYLAEQGHDVHVAGPVDGDAAAIEALGFPVHEVHLSRRGLSPLQEWRTLRGIRRVLDDLQPDLLHCFTIKPVIYGGLAARGRGIRLIQSITGLGYAFTEERLAVRPLRALLHKLYRRALAAGGTVVFQNEDDKDLFLSIGLVASEQVRLVPGSGVEMGRYEALAPHEGPFTVAFVGRYLRHKGILEFVEAARQEPEITWVLVGAIDPDNRASIAKRQLAAWVEEGIVVDWGWRDDICDVLPGIDVVCLPSYREGVPRALLEGGAAGRALVAADAPGSRDVVHDGVTGRLVPVGDAQALAAVVADLAADPNEVRRLGAAAMEHIAGHFSATAVNGQFAQIYREGPLVVGAA